MKVYYFFLILEKVKDEIYEDLMEMQEVLQLNKKDVILYGFTNKKELSKKFIQQRNMDKFIPFKTEMTSDEYDHFCRENRHNELYEHEYAYRSETGPSHCHILSTTFEYALIDYEYEDLERKFIIADKYSDLLFNFFKLLKKEWIVDIGIEEMNVILETGFSVANGEPVKLELNGFNILFNTFIETFL